MSSRSRRRGLGIIEILFAFSLICISVFTLISVFSKGSKHAVMSRNRTVAILLTHTLLDEVKAHPYGSKRPLRWNETKENPVTVWVEGRQQNMDFTKEIRFKNGSFVDEGEGENFDEVTITVRWKEGAGVNNGNKELTVKVPVWR